MAKQGTSYVNALAHWLNLHGMTSREFGRRLGMNSAAKLSQWMKGEKCPNMSDAYEIERITEGGVPMEAWLNAKDARAQIALLRSRQPPEYQPKKPVPEHEAARLEEEAADADS